MSNRPATLLAMLRRITGLLLLLALGAVFIISGWSKLETIEPFAWSFIDVLPIGITAASVIARIFIGLEWAIGAWLIAHIFLRRITYKATIALLLLLTAYLVGLLLHQGNTGNCGCFGEWLYMKPLAAIWKNLVMIAVVVLLWFLYPARAYRHSLAIGLVLAAAAFTLPFVFEPVYMGGTQVVKEPIMLDSLYTIGNPPPKVELRKGKHVVCFFSLTCPHCVKGAYLVQILHRQYPELPLFMVLGGGGFNAQSEFFEESKSESVPHTLIMDARAFSAMAGQFVPTIYWINNSVIERKTAHPTELEPGAIKDWLKQP